MTRHFDALPDACWLLGFVAVAFGVGMVSVAAGVIVAGLLLCLVGFVLGAGGD